MPGSGAGHDLQLHHCSRPSEHGGVHARGLVWDARHDSSWTTRRWPTTRTPGRSWCGRTTFCDLTSTTRTRRDRQGVRGVLFSSGRGPRGQVARARPRTTAPAPGRHQGGHPHDGINHATQVSLRRRCAAGAPHRGGEHLRLGGSRRGAKANALEFIERLPRLQICGRRRSSDGRRARHRPRHRGRRS